MTGITDNEESLIRTFLRGGVYCWVANLPGQWFAARDLVGGPNANWTGTPLIALYNKHVAAGKTPADAEEDAGKDLGWLLKAVLDGDQRTFDSRTHPSGVKEYLWVNPTPAAGGVPAPQ